MTARETMERHLQAALEGKMDIVVGDLVPEMVPVLQQLAPKLGEIKPTSFEILGERQEGDMVMVKATLVGKSRLTVEDSWKKQPDGSWKVVKIQPIE